ncbi:MAG: redox-regulated ATPase YchF [Sphaerobacteraceae bacterium]|nr:MAG: redox-regulated ATPase YchF [Sphaerobacteraceae bacterium]
MGLELVIMGLPQSGKTTVFNALTQATAETGGYSSGEDEPNLATVKVPDERLDILNDMFKPKRTVPAEVQYYDVAGLTKGVSEQGMSGRLLGYLSQAAALVHVVRAFEDDSVAHPEESIDPMRDIETLRMELTFSDLGLIERRRARIKDQINKLRGSERDNTEREGVILEQLQETLENGGWVRDVQLTPEDSRLIRGFGFLTEKPMLILLNVDENQLGGQADEMIAKAQEDFGREGVVIDALAGKIEAEIAQLDTEDAEMFLSDIGIKQVSRERVIRLSYDLLGLMSFFTVGEDENRAWTIRRGTPAVEAAGEIHSDIQRGFIRAEIVGYNDLIEANGWAEARKAGALRREGKTYVMQDGDVVHFLFNV